MSVGTRTAASTSLTSSSIAVRNAVNAAPGSGCAACARRTSRGRRSSAATRAPTRAPAPRGTLDRPSRRGWRRAARATPPRSAPTGSRLTDAPHPRVEEDEPGASLWIGGREEDADARAGAARPQHRPLRADVVHDGPDVVHRRLERLHLPHAVGEPVPRLSSISTRPQAARPSTWRTSSGCSQVERRSPVMPRTKTMSGAPVRPSGRRSRRRHCARSSPRAAAQDSVSSIKTRVEGPGVSRLGGLLKGHSRTLAQAGRMSCESASGKTVAAP